MSGKGKESSLALLGILTTGTLPSASSQKRRRGRKKSRSIEGGTKFRRVFRIRRVRADLGKKGIQPPKIGR